MNVSLPQIVTDEESHVFVIILTRQWRGEISGFSKYSGHDLVGMVKGWTR